MNNSRFQSFILATAVIAGSALTTHAQSWQTVDNYQYTPGLTAVSGAIGADGFGNVYAVGRGTPLVSCDERAIVRGSNNRGANWVNLDDYQESGFHGGHYRAFAAGDASGHLLVGGHIDPADDCVGQGDQTWIIRESFNGGATWSPADVPDPFQNNTGGSCADIAVHPASGDVYATGRSESAGWVVRRRSAGAPDFMTVEPLPGNSEQAGRAFMTAFHPGGAVFVVGELASPLGPVWTVRRSTDNGTTWTTVDSFRSAEWTSGSAQGIAVTASGTIYVTGQAFYSSRKNSGHRWVVRTSQDGGNTWSISDNFGSVGASGVDVAVDANGKPYVCGYGNGVWLVRALNQMTTIIKGKPVTTLAWTTIDSFQLASGQSARANGIAQDTVGNFYVSGSAHDESGVAHWIVRKLSATP